MSITMRAGMFIKRHTFEVFVLPISGPADLVPKYFEIFTLCKSCYFVFACVCQLPEKRKPKLPGNVLYELDERNITE